MEKTAVCMKGWREAAVMERESTVVAGDVGRMRGFGMRWPPHYAGASFDDDGYGPIVVFLTAVSYS